MSDYKKYSNCRFCSKPLFSVLDLGESAPANAYIDPQKPHINNKYNLNLCLCSYCGCAQLDTSVNADILFKNYKYSSSTVPSLVKYFSQYADDLPIKQNSKILEIGSNDGVLLKPLKDKGFDVVGVEPSQNLADIANNQGLTTECCFFNEKEAEKIFAKYSKFDCITSNNCFAHIDDIHSVISGITKLLKNDGIFVFENAYLLDTVNGLYFDQLYFEHIFYHSIKPLSLLFEQYNLEIFNVKLNKNQGGSIKVFVKSVGNKRSIHPIVKELINKEEESGIYNVATYQLMINKLQELKNHFYSFLQKELNKGKTFCAYGAAAKFTTFANFFELYNKIKYVVDDSPLKWGLQTPEGGLNIVSPDYFKENKTNYCIISAWNFAEAIAAKNKWYTDDGGKFVKVMPSLEIF